MLHFHNFTAKTVNSQEFTADTENLNGTREHRISNGIGCKSPTKAKGRKRKQDVSHHDILFKSTAQLFTRTGVVKKRAQQTNRLIPYAFVMFPIASNPKGRERGSLPVQRARAIPLFISFSV